MWEVEVIVCSKKRPKLLITMITVLVLRLMSQNPETGNSEWGGFWLQKKRFISYQQSDQRYDSRGLWLMVGQSVVWVSVHGPVSSTFDWTCHLISLAHTSLHLMPFTLSIFKRVTPSLLSFSCFDCWLYLFLLSLPHVPMCSTICMLKKKKKNVCFRDIGLWVL